MTEPVAPIARSVLQWIVIAAVAIMVVFAIFPRLDVAVSSLFFDPGRGRFPFYFNTVLNGGRDVVLNVVIGISVLALLALLARVLLPLRRPLMPSRAAIFLVLTMALGPGLLVNGVLKPHGGRPRPAEVVAFKGPDQFVAWWNTGGACRQNCSFVSGDVATAAWTFAPAMLLPMPWRLVAVGAATVLTAGFAAVRVMAGAHFVTDVVGAVLLTLFLVWLLHALIYRWPETRVSESAVDAGVVRVRDAWLGGLSWCAQRLAATLRATADLVGDLPLRWEALRAGLRQPDGEDSSLARLWRRARMPSVRFTLDPDLLRFWKWIRRDQAPADEGVIVTLTQKADDADAAPPDTKKPNRS